MNRREFAALLGSTAATFWLPANAQQDTRIRHVGVLLPGAESDPDYRLRLAAFRQALEQLGWIADQNVRFDVRHGSNADLQQTYAAELVAASPDVILAGANSPLVYLQRATKTIPIVFAQVPDPVAGGFVPSLAHPGGNTTGFANYEQRIVVKWIELLKQLAPRVARVVFVFDPANPAADGYVLTAEEVAPSFGIRVATITLQNADDLVRTVGELADEPNTGLIILPSPTVTSHRQILIDTANQHSLPTVSPFRDFVAAGCLASYGVDNVDLYRNAASYVDRILKGEKPGDLPVQYPTKYQLVINLKTAKALGLEPPVALLARTDEVIE